MTMQRNITVTFDNSRNFRIVGLRLPHNFKKLAHKMMQYKYKHVLMRMQISKIAYNSRGKRKSFQSFH